MKLVVVILCHIVCLMQLQVPGGSESTCSSTEEMRRAAVDKALADIGCGDRLCALFKAFPELNQTTTDISGLNSSNPARSCADILDANAQSPSGYYWLQSANGSAVRVYCNMTLTCQNVSGGWIQVIRLDLSNDSLPCPDGLRLRIDLLSRRRTCGRRLQDTGCSSTTFATNGVQYSQVCGRVIGYQDRLPDAFGQLTTQTIDGSYVDGISLTHGSNPRQHIWTFAAARGEDGQFPHTICPCTNINHTAVAPPSPSFVGNDYFCETGSETSIQAEFFPDDPLWDGAGCGPLSTCCSFNNPPWFRKQLPSGTSDDIEMRLCQGDVSDEDTPVQIVELYVR